MFMPVYHSTPVIIRRAIKLPCVHFALSALACLLVAVPAQSQVAVEVSPFPGGDYCVMGNDQGPGLRTAFVGLAFNIGASAARFKLMSGPGVTMTYVSESTPYASSGDTQDGIAICFNTCLVGPVTIATVTYMSHATDERCSELRVVPHPEAETVEVATCDGATVAAYSIDMIIIPPSTPPCPCPAVRLYPGTPMPFDCSTVATENTTWGRVKALYRR